MIITVKNNLMNDFADWLKENRRREKISLRGLADKIGNLCSDAFLSQLENRKYLGKKGKPMRPDKEIVVALAEALNADENEALRLADYATEEKPSTKKIVTAADFAEFLKANNITDFRLTESDMKKMEETGFDELIDYLKAFFIVKIEKFDNKGEVLEFPKSDKGKAKTGK